MYNINQDFDFTEFSSKILRTIDSMRTTGKEASKEPLESRINAFYRAIGLPAVDTGTGTSPDPKNNGNLYVMTNKNKLLELEKKFSQRESKSKSMATSIAAGTQEGTFDYNTRTVTDGITEEGKKIRPSLFPMMVDGRIPIFPAQKRVAGAFMLSEENKYQDRVEYATPFLEFIISLRFKGEGLYNAATQKNATPKKIESVTEAINLEFGKISADIKLELKASIANISRRMSEIKAKIDNTRQYISGEVQQDESGHAEQNTSVEENPESTAALDALANEQEKYLALKHARLLLFDFDDTTMTGPNTKSTSKDVIATRNLKKAVLASQFLGLIVSDAGTIEKSKKETDKKKEKAESELKKANSELDYVLGTFSGLSGTDVMAVIYALFTVKLDVLLSLLNDDSLERAGKYFGKEKGITRPMSVEAAVTELERNVSYIIVNDIAPQMQQDKHSQKNTNKK